MKNLDKLVESVVFALDPNASKEILQQAKQKANEIFHRDVNDFLDEMEITIGKKDDYLENNNKK